MIVSKTLEIPKYKDNKEIENALKEMMIEPLRWAIVEVRENSYRVSVSFEVSA